MDSARLKSESNHSAMSNERRQAKTKVSGAQRQQQHQQQAVAQKQKQQPAQKQQSSKGSKAENNNSIGQKRAKAAVVPTTTTTVTTTLTATTTTTATATAATTTTTTATATTTTATATATAALKTNAIETQPANKTSKSKKSKKKSKNLSDPVKIIEEVLAKSSFKVPNLSHSVEERFYNTAEGEMELSRGLEDVIYMPTVGPVENGSLDTRISVMPESFRGYVNLSPSAIMSLKCMNFVPDKRWVRRRKNPGNKSSNKNNNNGQHNKNDNKSNGNDGNGSANISNKGSPKDIGNPKAQKQLKAIEGPPTHQIQEAGPTTKPTIKAATSKMESQLQQSNKLRTHQLSE